MNIRLVCYVSHLLIGIALVLTTSQALLVTPAQAAEEGGLGDASAITGIDDVASGPAAVKTVITNVVTQALTFVALLATIVIIIGGVFLVAGAGSDSSIERAKKIILYAIVGILVIVLAGAIVKFIIEAGSGGTA